MVARQPQITQASGLQRRIRLADRTHAVTPFLAMEFLDGADLDGWLGEKLAAE